MIDIRKAKQEFKKYVSNYDIKNDRIRVKIAHIERTASIAKEIAQNLKLSEEDIQLAELIGLLHDIGRFEQVKKYNTFIDKNSVNHGQLGVQILFEQGLIYNFLEDRQYDEIIRKSILNHNRNKANIETSNDREKMHTNIIRDADKTDIIYMLTFEKKETAWESNEIEKQKASDEIYQEFIENQSINYQNRKTSVDNLISHFAYVYDFSYDCALQVIKHKDYFKIIYQRFKFEDKETQNKIDEIYKIVEQYLEKR
ncbi:MAG: HD domain-containing protein [Clostridia bacterium]|nr:HD domain-containing protein [Clostridia bacterium]